MNNYDINEYSLIGRLIINTGKKDLPVNFIELQTDFNKKDVIRVLEFFQERGLLEIKNNTVHANLDLMKNAIS
ncbi:MAG: hypothetical protein FVQ77_05815 [Cytophagales bacterium]|nr:hypothetical protein [Cytophagales bacterium]